MKIQLSDHFTYGKLIRFTVPSIAMMIFTSIYGVVDGVFVSNFVGETPFAALNLIMPYIMIFSTLGFMFGSGGSALVAVTLGMGDRKRANEIFSLIVYTMLVLGIVLGTVGFLLAEPVARLLGATNRMLPYCVLYARINMLGIAPFMLQNGFQTFFITAEKPQLGFWVTVAAGVTNMILDGVFMGILHLGLGSAAAATVIGICVGGIIPLVYFSRENTSLLRLTRTHFMGKALLKAITNGSSEFLSTVSMSVVTMLYNIQLLRYAGERGVSAYGIIMYTNFIFIGVFLGYAMGSAPIVGFHYGTGKKEELRNVFKKSLRMIGGVSVIMCGVSFLLARPLATIFASRDAELLAMTEHAIRIYSLAYLVMGFSIYGSSFFTALNNGFVSATISFLRTLVFEVAAVMILPIVFGLDGIWMAIVAAETGAVIVSVGCLWKYRKRYGYV